jgi:hypothetical protein
LALTRTTVLHAIMPYAPIPRERSLAIYLGYESYFKNTRSLKIFHAKQRLKG